MHSDTSLGKLQNSKEKVQRWITEKQLGWQLTSQQQPWKLEESEYFNVLK